MRRSTVFLLDASVIQSVLVESPTVDSNYYAEELRGPGKTSSQME